VQQRGLTSLANDSVCGATLQNNVNSSFWYPSNIPNVYFQSQLNDINDKKRKNHEELITLSLIFVDRFCPNELDSRSRIDVLGEDARQLLIVRENARQRLPV